MVVVKRLIPKTIREVATNLQNSQVKKFEIYEINNRSELEAAKRKLSNLWSMQNDQKTRVSIIVVCEKIEQNS